MSEQPARQVSGEGRPEAEAAPSGGADATGGEPAGGGEAASSGPDVGVTSGAPQEGAGPKAVWYYAVRGKAYGPVSEGQLIDLSRREYFSKRDHVYAAHIGKWVEASQVAGLFEPAGAAMPGAPFVVAAEGGEPLPGTAAALYAGFWIRLAAVVIDWLIIWFGLAIGTGGCFAAFWLKAARNMGSNAGREFSPGFFAFFGVWYLAMIVIVWLYFALCESSRWQATIGKKAAGIVVTDVAGRRISFGRATARFFASWISGIIFDIGYIIGAFTPNKQTLHDMIAGTLVVYGKRE